MSEDVTQDLNDLRKKVLNGEEVSSEEYARVLEALRTNREAEKTKKRQTTTKKAAPKKEPSKAAEDLLKGFDLGAEVNGKNG